MSELLHDATPMVVELSALFFISVLFVGLIVFTDITFHDSYVKNLIADCYAENQNDICMDFRHKLGLPDDAHMELGNPYWMLLSIQAIVIPLGLAGFRALMVFLRKSKWTALRIFVIFLWAMVPFSLFYFGAIDVFYYLGRNMQIPNQLDWLNHVGIFEKTKVFGIDPLNVESSDLLFTFGIGVLFIGLLFFIATKMYQNSGLRSVV